MSTSSTLSARDRTLRYITILLWIPAFGILLAHGILTGTVAPALGILPMTGSAIAGVIHLRGWAKNKAANTIVELSLVLSLLGVFVPSQVVLSNACHGWYCASSRGLTMLGAYGSVPLLVNILLHAFFLLRDFSLHPFQPRHCPHCHGNLTGKKTSGQSTSCLPSRNSSDGKESYHSVANGDDEDIGVEGSKNAEAAKYNDDDDGDYSLPRPSTDDETARLV